MNNAQDNWYIYLSQERYAKRIISKANWSYEDYISMRCRGNPNSSYQYISCNKKIIDTSGPLIDNTGTTHSKKK